MKLYCDFETRSTAKLKLIGAWKYSLDPSTEVLCLSWRCTNGEKGFWHCEHPGIFAATPLPTRLFELMADPTCTIEAHNSFFELAIWTNICVPKMGWPAIRPDAWRCSAAKAAACSLPRDLEGAGNALSLQTVKSDEGHRIMLKLCKPAKATKKFPNRKWHEDSDDLMALWDYCETDTAAEEALSDALPNLSKYEQRIWEMDQRMNARGIFIDVEGVRKAIKLAEQCVAKLNEELHFLTGLDTAGQREKITAWVREQGVDLFDTQAETLDRMVKRDDLPRNVHRVLQIVRSAGRSSVKKYTAMLEMATEDCRARGTMMYHGAGTGRWTGKGLQPHNFPRGGLKNMEGAWRAIHNWSLEDIEMVYGDAMEFLSHALRGAIIAPPDRELFCGDYASIEARVLFWLAGEIRGTEVFRRKGDIYCIMASDIYDRPITKKDVLERMFGKQAILGLGFGMGFVKFLVTCRKYNIKFTDRQVLDIVGIERYAEIAEWIQTDGWKWVKQSTTPMTTDDVPSLVLMKYVVERYRERYDTVPKYWKQLERAAISAVQNPGVVFTAGKTKWAKQGVFLKCQLPSGRKLFYPFPEVEMTGWGPKLSYMGVHPKTHQWVRQDTYGGSLCENVVQATARDIMAHAMLLCDEGGKFSIEMSVHDEIVADAPIGLYTIDEFLELIITLPDWAEGCPVDAEGWKGPRYMKQ